ncbi:MAG: cadherin-like domain-containing protein, partial [Deltaproteobacteria bacterium]|nr:cadherin-like domain-containing protein [Deltaproteobacteria bacterium]
MSQDRIDPWGVALLTLGMAGGCFSVTGTPADPGDETDTDDDPSTDSGDGSTGSGDAHGDDEPNNDAPNPRADGPYLASGPGPLEVGAAAGVLSNDEDPDADRLTAQPGMIDTNAGGTVVMAADGSFTYTAAAALPYGTDRFQYVVVDEHGAEAEAEVRVVVAPPAEGIELMTLGPQGRSLEGVVANDRAGREHAGAGDLDGDGFGDVVVVTSRQLGAETLTELALVRGGPNRESMHLDQPDVRIAGLVSSSPTVVPAGDVNGDGFDDLLVGDHEGADDAGIVYVVLGGSALGAIENIGSIAVRFDGIAAGDRAGIAVAGAGDFDGDGIDDFVVGASQPQVVVGGTEQDPILAEGEAYLVRGRSDFAVQQVRSLDEAELHLHGHQSGGSAGAAVAGIGDLDGDGLDDIAIGAPYVDRNTSENAGEVHVVFGHASPAGVRALNTADVRIRGTQPWFRIGDALSGIGDFDGDGRADFVIGASRDDSGGGDAGAAYLVMGASEFGTTHNLPELGIRLEGLHSGDLAGASVSGVGDFDGDGLDDVFVGADRANDIEASGTGEAYLVLGRVDAHTLGGRISADLRLRGSADGDRAGRRVGAAGDIDGDGFDDLIVSAHRLHIDDEADVGAAFVVFGDDLRATVSVLGTATG